MKEMTLFLLKSLLGNDQDVILDVKEEQNKIYMSTTLDPINKGKIIGKDGCIVKHIRILLSATGASKGKKVFLKIED
ncbi:hypothetical protein Dip518_000258 [Parelusimicrobium proximum]|uniref:KH domain-containing protein n=1 Tax=Parelusimicrobium proximum TaxID=3228953 RepID=UPI003D167131